MPASERTQTTDTPSLCLEPWDFPSIDWEQLQEKLKQNWEEINQVAPRWYYPLTQSRSLQPRPRFGWWG